MIKDVTDWDRCVEEVNTCRDELLAEGLDVLVGELGKL